MENEVNNEKSNSKIFEYFTFDKIKHLYYNALRLDIEDNNDRADIAKYIAGNEFEELGTGTNRITLKRDNYAVKIALDRRGLVDNLTEFIRSPYLEQFCAKTYESNALINIMEYVTLMDKSQFTLNREPIKLLLDELSKVYIFEDLGFASLKNFTNYGYRSDGSIVVLDYGYLYPKQGNEDALMCRKCGTELEYDKYYSNFVCPNSVCGAKYRIMDIRRNMDMKFEEHEKAALYALHGIEMPNFNTLIDDLYK